MSTIVREGTAAHVFAGTDLAPGSYAGSAAVHPAETPTSAEILARAGVAGDGRGILRTVRQRFTVAQVNAGVTLLAARPGVQRRMVDAYMVAIGGNAATATGVLLRGTRGGSAVTLMDAKVAGLTRSTILRLGTATNGLPEADGVSMTALDVNTAVTVIKDGSDVATATHIDVSFTYEEIVT